MPYKQSSSVAVAGAVIGAVLALFIITIFIIVLLTPRKKRSSYLDKILKEDQIQNLQDSINVKLYYCIRKEVIDLPPTQKPTSSYEKRNLSRSQKEIINAKMINCSRFSYEDENPASQDRDQQKYPVPKETNCKDWINKKHPNTGNGRIYSNPREHYI
ncbi:hypothetical protein E2320_005259 [Naja naja]|nr:hypothetical protein E2320_005259 [Naja naja]